MGVPSEEELGPLPDHTKRADLELIADAMRALDGDALNAFAFSLIDANLMVQTWEDKETAAVIEAARDAGMLPTVLKLMFHTVDGSARGLVDEAVNHCLNGKDETDPASAGGWNQDELETAYAALYVARNGLTIPFGSNVQ